MTTTPTAPSVVKTGRRWSLRAGVVAALIVSALPASATVIVQNFMTVDVTRAAPCLAKINGFDTGAVATNLLNTTLSAQNVPLLNERVTLQGYRGDRLTITDSIRVSNTCGYGVNVFLRAEPGPATGSTTTSGNWSDLHMKVYLGKNLSVPADTTGLSGTDFTVATDWDNDPILVNATQSAAGSVLLGDAQTGTFLVPAGQSIQLGYVIDVGSATAAVGPPVVAASPAAGITATLNYTVNATKA